MSCPKPLCIAPYKISVVSIFTGGAYRHKGKLIVLIVILAIIDAGPARRLIP